VPCPRVAAAVAAGSWTAATGSRGWAPRRAASAPSAAGCSCRPARRLRGAFHRAVSPMAEHHDLACRTMLCHGRLCCKCGLGCCKAANGCRLLVPQLLAGSMASQRTAVKHTESGLLPERRLAEPATVARSAVSGRPSSFSEGGVAEAVDGRRLRHVRRREGVVGRRLRGARRRGAPVRVAASGTQVCKQHHKCAL